MNTQASRLLTPCALVLLVATSPWALADQNTNLPQLKHNPFVAPALIEEPAPVEAMGIAEEDLIIRGVLTSQKGTLININGSILGLQGFIEGYQLVSLDGQKAVLSKNGQEIVLAFPSTRGAAGSNQQKRLQSGQ